jgi:hypothetical protein
MKKTRLVRLQATTRWTLVGMTLVAAYAALAISDWRLAWLSALQEIELYKQLTGLVLVILFAAQWRLTAVRMKGEPRLASRFLPSHRYWGALAPVWLYLHADDLGHAYIRAMCLAFLGLVCLGLLQQLVTRLHRSWLTSIWLVTHVALAAMLIPLIGFHAFNSFYYE